MFRLLEVVRPDVMPELAKQSFIGLVVGVGLGIGNLKVGAELMESGRERSSKTIDEWSLRSVVVFEMEVAVLRVKPDQFLQKGHALTLSFTHVFLL